MAKKYYAVKEGYKVGIYQSWEECKKQVDGFSGAVYKSFGRLSEAKEYLGIEKVEKDRIISMKSDAIAYVDGSYDDLFKEFSYGLVMFDGEEEKHFAEKYNTKNLIAMRNVAGEIIGAQKAMQYCIDNGVASLDLYYDYEGIEKWCTGEWKANKEGTKLYKQFYDDVKSDLQVTFYKVVAHTGDKYNEIADQLAKKAIKGEVYILKREVDIMAKDNSVYLDRENIYELIEQMGETEWGEGFSAAPIYQKGKQYRCDFTVNSITESIDIFFRIDGKTTLKKVGNSQHYADRLIEMLKSTAYVSKNQNTNCTFSNVTDKTYLQLIGYLSSIDKINKDEEREIQVPPHKHIKFSSAFGDTMVVNRYNTGKLVLQGTPAYILTEALSLMSMSSEISLEEIVERKNEAYKSNITVHKTHEELRQRLPNTYDKLDDIIIKLLSPSIALSTSGIQVEDYSCYVFPALKALEALLLRLLSDKQIYRPANNSFGSIFRYDASTLRHKLNHNYIVQINDATYVQCVEDIYNYFKQVRHNTFHANQVLNLTKKIDDKAEADTILNEVLTLFEDTGIKVLK